MWKKASGCLLLSCLPIFAVAEVDQEQMISICASCHGIGAGGAPKVGSQADWQPRLDKGMEVLIESVKSGVPGTLMAGGICRDCSDEEIEQIILKLSTGS